MSTDAASEPMVQETPASVTIRSLPRPLHTSSAGIGSPARVGRARCTSLNAGILAQPGLARTAADGRSFVAPSPSVHGLIEPSIIGAGHGRADRLSCVTWMAATTRDT